MDKLLRLVEITNVKDKEWSHRRKGFGTFTLLSIKQISLVTGKNMYDPCHHILFIHTMPDGTIHNSHFINAGYKPLVLDTIITLPWDAK